MRHDGILDKPSYLKVPLDQRLRAIDAARKLRERVPKSLAALWANQRADRPVRPGRPGRDRRRS